MPKKGTSPRGIKKMNSEIGTFNMADGEKEEPEDAQAKRIQVTMPEDVEGLCRRRKTVFKGVPEKE